MDRVGGSPARKQRRAEQRRAAAGPRRPQDRRNELRPDRPTGGREVVGVELYLEAGDIFTRVPSSEAAIDVLRGVPVERTLSWIGERLLGSALPGELWEEQQRAFAATIRSDTAVDGRVRDLVLSGKRQLFVPHVLFQMARLALLHGSRSPAGDYEDPLTVAENYGKLLPAMLVIGHHQSSHNITVSQLQAPETPGEVPISALELELAGNILSNHRPYAASMLDRSARRWIEIPAADDRESAVDLAAEYEAATGVPLDDLRTVGMALWSRAFGSDGPRFRPEHLEKLGLTPERVAAVLNLISGTVDDLAAEARRENASGDYDSSLFGRRPLIRLADGQVLILSPLLLVERTLGWVPRWDLREGFFKQGKAGRKREANAERYLRESTEAHAVETLRAVAAAGRRQGTVYGEREIQSAYGTGDRNADVAMNWERTWVVAEISTRPPMRGTASGGSAADLLTDLNHGVLAKAEQIDATIAAIRADESKLTGRPARGQLRFMPLLVATEGFPVTPHMTERIRLMLKRAGICEGHDTAPLVIVDIQALELTEAVTESGAPELPRLLAEHRKSPFRSYALPTWLVSKYGSRQAPKRIMARWDRVFDAVLKLLEDAESEAGGPPEDP